MGTLLIILVIAVLLVIGLFSLHKRVTKGCCESSDTQAQPKKQIDQTIADYPYTAVVHIEGMHCDNCARKIANAYAEKDCLALVSREKKQAVVHMKTRLSNELLIAIPSRLGYDARILTE